MCVNKTICSNQGRLPNDGSNFFAGQFFAIFELQTWKGEKNPPILRIYSGKDSCQNCKVVLFLKNEWATNSQKGKKIFERIFMDSLNLGQWKILLPSSRKDFLRYKQISVTSHFKRFFSFKNQAWLDFGQLLTAIHFESRILSDFPVVNTLLQIEQVICFCIFYCFLCLFCLFVCLFLVSFIGFKYS